MCKLCVEQLQQIKQELRAELQSHLEEILITLMRHNESLSADLEIQLKHAIKASADK